MLLKLLLSPALLSFLTSDSQLLTQLLGFPLSLRGDLLYELVSHNDGLCILDNLESAILVVINVNYHSSLGHVGIGNPGVLLHVLTLMYVQVLSE